MKKKILCIVGWWPSEGNYTGIFIKEHVKAIQLLHEVEVVYLEVQKGSLKFSPFHIISSMEDGIPVHRITVITPLRRFGMIPFLARFAFSRFIPRLQGSKKFAMVHVHVRTEITEQIKSIARKFDLPIVITEHNSFYHLGIHQLSERLAIRTKRSIMKWFDDDRIISVMPVSMDLGRVLHEDYGVASTKITIVPNVASEEFIPAARPPDTPYTILLAAVWRPPKDHDVFIQALKLLPNDLLSAISIEWAGYGPAYQDIIVRCRKELPDVQFTFPGAMAKPMLARSMQRSHLFVLPTLADNLPCVVLESHCCGTPVISMRVNGVPELIDEQNGILVPPGDPQALAKALIECISDPYGFDRGEISRKALARYSRNVIADRINVVYGMVEAMYRSIK